MGQAGGGNNIRIVNLTEQRRNKSLIIIIFQSYIILCINMSVDPHFISKINRLCNCNNKVCSRKGIKLSLTLTHDFVIVQCKQEVSARFTLFPASRSNQNTIKQQQKLIGSFGNRKKTSSPDS